MAKICNECGYPLKGIEDKCPECGSTVLINQTISKNIRSININNGDNEAEVILEDTLNFFRKLIIVLFIIAGIFCFIGCIALDLKRITDIPIFWFFGLILGGLTILVGFGVAKLIWAVGMIFINISTNVRTIKHLIIK